MELEIGERIKKLRKTYSMSQATFSKQIGISQGTLSEIECSRFLPSVGTVISISKEFDVRIDWILLGIGSATQEAGFYNINGQLTKDLGNLVQEFMMKLTGPGLKVQDDVLYEMITAICTIVFDESLNSSEIELLKGYRNLSPKDKKEIQAIVDLKQ